MYQMELVSSDAELIINAVNQGIDSHLQAVTDSTFAVDGHRLVCKIAANDLRVIIRRLLESNDDVIERAENLVYAILGTLGVNDFWLATEDRFYITLDEDYFDRPEDFEVLASELDLPYVSVFDDTFWPRLVDRE